MLLWVRRDRLGIGGTVFGGSKPSLVGARKRVARPSFIQRGAKAKLQGCGIGLCPDLSAVFAGEASTKRFAMILLQKRSNHVAASSGSMPCRSSPSG